MSFEFVKKLPAPNEIKRDFPVPERIARLKAQRDAEIRDVITGKADKFLAIIGPCSADNETAVLDYTLRLKKVQEKIKDKVIIFHAYTQTNRVQPVPVTRECYISRTLKRSRIYSADWLQSVKCTSTSWSRPS